MRTKAVVLVACLVGVGAAGCEKSPEPPRGTIAPLDVAAPPADAVTTPSGLVYRVLVGGRGGPHPGPQSRVVIHYTGWTPDGAIVEGAPIGGAPATFQLSETMPGWQEGLRMMRVGEKRRFWIPGRLAYGDQPGKPRGMLVYDIDLVQFVD
jgi:FKBP-type peptidyl-prolyl cis-trans isomerase